MPKIAIWGCYNQGFISDDLLYKAISDEIKYQTLDVDIVAVNHETDIDADFCIIGGGTLIGEPLKNFQYHNKPFCILGAGYREGNIPDFIHKAVFIKTRGELSARKIRGMGFWAESCGDPIVLLKRQRSKIYPTEVITITRGGIDKGLDEWAGSKVRESTYCGEITEAAINKIPNAKKVNSARLHPFLLALSMGIPAETYQFEFAKVDDALDGLGLEFVRHLKKGDVYEVNEYFAGLAKEKIDIKRKELQKLITDILELCLR